MLGNILTFERLFKIKRLSVAPGLRRYDDDGNNDGDIFFFLESYGTEWFAESERCIL